MQIQIEGKEYTLHEGVEIMAWVYEDGLWVNRPLRDNEIQVLCDNGMINADIFLDSVTAEFA